jgi:hypothetical protein
MKYRRHQNMKISKINGNENNGIMKMKEMANEMAYGCALARQRCA